GGGGGPPLRPSLVKQVLNDKPVPLKDWHHVVWTWNRELKKLTFYMDGDSVAQQDKDPGVRSLDIPVSNQPMRIGSQVALMNGTQPRMNGLLDELWIFDKALT